MNPITTKIAFVGCGYVFDIYMRSKWAYPEFEIRGVFDIDRQRLAVVSAHYNLHAYTTLDDLLDDSEVEVVVNLTSIPSHFEITSAALRADKHVYSEKPLTLELDETRQLFKLASERDRTLSGAPCNLFSDAVCTVWKAIRDGAIGKPVLVYAELDDNPAHLMHLEAVRSPTGAPFPYVEELQAGCTVEHVAYHLAWLCAIFGPVQSVTAASSWLVVSKTVVPLDPEDAPDVSVAYLTFANGVVARVTCSWVAPRNHSFRVVGDEGVLAVDNVFHDQSPVHLERFSRVSLTVRKAYSARTHPGLGRRFGLGGRRLPLVQRWKSHAVETERGVGTSSKHRVVGWVRRREIYAQDKFLGIAEMARAMAEGRPQPMPGDFLLHLNELTLLIHRAGHDGIATKPTTSFAALSAPDLLDGRANYRDSHRPRILETVSARLVESLHKD